MGNLFVNTKYFLMGFLRCILKYDNNFLFNSEGNFNVYRNSISIENRNDKQLVLFKLLNMKKDCVQFSK